MAPVLRLDTEYVLYVRPFELVGGVPTDEHVVLGVGAFEVDGAAIIVPEQADCYSGFPEETVLGEIEELAQQSD